MSNTFNTNTHTQTRISHKFIDVKKIHFRKGEILATPFYLTQKKSHLLVMEKPLDTKKIPDDCISEQLVW